MKAILACAAAAMLASSAVAAEPGKVDFSSALRHANGMACLVYASRGKHHGWYGHVYAATSRYRLVMDITDGSDGRDIINNVDITSIDGQLYQVLHPRERLPVQEILDEACPKSGLSRSQAAVMKIARSY